MAINGKVAALIGALIFVVLAAALAPSMFENLNITGAPVWVSTVLPLIVGAGLVFAVWKAFN